MKKLLILILVAAVSPAFSQGLTSASYSMGFGTGDLGDHTGMASFRGFTVDFRKLVQPNIAVGIELGWNVFYDDKLDDVYTRGNVSYSGKQYRYNNQFPMLVRGDYYLKPGEKINPYVGFGLGTMFSMKATDMGQYRFEEDAWQFAIKPEVGVEFELNPAANAFIAAKFYNGFKGGDLPNQGYFTINVGMVFKN
jgi:opacity protein-like surface antigen